MGKIITVAIEKGGVGKTTTVTNLAAIYGMSGQTVLICDLDPQGNCTKCLSGGKPKSEYNGHGVFDMLRSFQLVKASEFVTPTSIENVDMIPCNEYSEQIMNLLPILKAQYGRPEYVYLAACLGDIVNNYDVVLIDTPSAKGFLVSSALFCADEVIIPFYADGYSIDGMNGTYAIINKLREDEHANINVLGILMTRVERTASTNYLRDLIRASDFGGDLFETEIRKSVAISDSTILSVPVVVSDKKSKPAQDYQCLYEEMNARLRAREG